MATTNILPFRSDRKDATLQTVATTQKKASRRPTSSATAINQHIRASVIRLAFDSCLDINRFSNIAKYAGTRESVALNVIRNHERDLQHTIRHLRDVIAELKRGGDPPSGPGVIRRKAA